MSAIDVVIPTKDRPRDLERCLESLSAVSYPAWSLWIADQSVTAESAAVAERFRPKFQALLHLPLASTGISRSRNAALASSHAPLIAFLDDDCTVAPDWLSKVAAAFERHPSAELIFGRVSAAPHDAREILLPAFDAAEGADVWDSRPMGAAMYLRRSLFERLGEFDELLGVGSSVFESGEDTDYRYRALSSGAEVAIEPDITVLHHGARDYSSGSARRLIRSTAFSRGATDMKLLRLGQRRALKLIGKQLGAYWKLIKIPILSGSSELRASMLVYYALGLAASLRFDVDRARALYKKR